MRSKILERTGVIEIGLYSEGVVGERVLAIGRIEADFHYVGTTDVDKDRFIMAASRAAKKGAPTRRNHAGMPSKPVAVWWSVSRISNIRQSDK